MADSAGTSQSGDAHTVNKRSNSYTAYSIGCAGVWGAILIVARRRLDAQAQNTLRLVCGGWWMGWSSATIARIAYPPPKPLTPGREKKLRLVASAFATLGLSNAVRVLVAGKLPETRSGA